jgi:hypothetical protein
MVKGMGEAPYQPPAAVGAEPDKDLVRVQITFTAGNRPILCMSRRQWESFYNRALLNTDKHVRVLTKKDPQDPESKVEFFFFKPAHIVSVQVLTTTFDM